MFQGSHALASSFILFSYWAYNNTRRDLHSLQDSPTTSYSVLQNIHFMYLTHMYCIEIIDSDEYDMCNSFWICHDAILSATT